MNNQSNEFLFLDDLKKCFNRGESILKKALKKCYAEKRNVTIKGVETLVVKPIKKNNRLSLSLLNHPKAIQSFKDFCFDEGILLNPKPKREGMLSAMDLFQQYSCPYAFFNKVLLSCYKEGKSFQANGEETPLVEMCLSGSQQILALNEDRQALEIFKSICAEKNTPLVIMKKQEGMLSAVDLSKLYNKPADVFMNLLQKCFDEDIHFSNGHETLPLVQQVKSGGIQILATNKDKDALSHFIRYAASNGILLKKTTKARASTEDFFKIIREKVLTFDK